MIGRTPPHPTTDSSIGLTLALCVAVTLAAAFSPEIQFAYRQPGLHIAIETAAALVAALAAFLVGGRFARSHRLDDLLLSAALATLAVTNLLLGVVPSALLSLPLDSSWIWAQLLGLLLGSVIFALGSFAAPVALPRPAASAAVLAMAGLALVAVVAALAAAAGLDRSRPRSPPAVRSSWTTLG